MSNTPNYNALRAAGLLDASLDTMAASEPEWIESFMALVHESQLNNILDPKLVALIRLVIDVSATHLYASGIERHIRDALRLGLSRVEILEVFKLASIVGIHSCALGVPILEKQLTALGLEQDTLHIAETPICDAIRAQGTFNPLWETLYRWDPLYLENFLIMSAGVWQNNILPTLWVEFLCIAVDASVSHLWSDGTQRHIKAALLLGATKSEILEVLKIISLQGIEACELGMPLLEKVLNENDVVAPCWNN